MKKKLRVLLIEDSDDDAVLVEMELKKDGYDIFLTRIQTEAEMEEALSHPDDWDVVISDYSIPGFGGLEALKLFRAKGLLIPFFIVSDTTGEETAIAAMKEGADDYIMKRKLGRLVPAIERELRDAEVRMMRQSAEKALLESERRLRSIIEGSLDAVIVAEANGHISWWNHAAENTFGWKNEEAIGRSLVDMIFPARDRRQPPQLNTRVEMWGLHKDGHEFPMECFLAPIVADEKISGHSFFAHNITERKHTEESMRQANLRLEELHRTKSEFTSMVSHELRTPLAAIKEGIQIILDELDGPITKEQRDTLDIVDGNIDRFARMVNNVLDFSKLESGNMKMNFRMTNLNELIDDVCELTRPLAEKKSIALEVDLPDRPLSSVCDSDNMQQVIINLLNNAIKFTEAGGGITVRLKHTVRSIVLEVEDTGVGVREEDREKIFEMYTQSFRRGIWMTGGSGIGLSVCKKIVELHHGAITVKGAPNVGSIFTVMFPKGLKETFRKETEAAFQ